MSQASPNLAGKIVVITGGNSGIGKEAAVELAYMGAHIVIAARNPQKAAAAVKEVHERANSERVETIPLDLASFAAVHAFVDAFNAQHDRCDVLLNNAGLVLRKRTTTVDGHETTFQVNHLGHFLLTHLMRDTLVRSAPARVINVSSEAHKWARKGLDFDDLEWEHRRYRGFGVYSATKLMNILNTRELAAKGEGAGVTANAVHPGYVASNFAKEGDMGFMGTVAMQLGRPFARSVEQGARTSVYLASSHDVDGITGQYFYDNEVKGPSAFAVDAAAGARLWEISSKLTAG